jgi:hypothetical protein
MKVMVFVKATTDSEAGAMPTPELIRDMMAYNEELIKAGIIKGGDGLQPSSKGVRIRFSGKNRTVTHGPFAETNELVAGYWLWEVKDMEEAIAWAKRCPNPMFSDSDLELRPILSPEEFGDLVTPELMATYNEMQKQ